MEMRCIAHKAKNTVHSLDGSVRPRNVLLRKSQQLPEKTDGVTRYDTSLQHWNATKNPNKKPGH